MLWICLMARLNLDMDLAIKKVVSLGLTTLVERV